MLPLSPRKANNNSKERSKHLVGTKVLWGDP